MLFTCTRIAEDSILNFVHVLRFKHLEKSKFLKVVKTMPNKC